MFVFAADDTDDDNDADADDKGVFLDTPVNILRGKNQFRISFVYNGHCLCFERCFASSNCFHMGAYFTQYLPVRFRKRSTELLMKSSGQYAGRMKLNCGKSISC